MIVRTKWLLLAAWAMSACQNSTAPQGPAENPASYGGGGQGPSHAGDSGSSSYRDAGGPSSSTASSGQAGSLPAAGQLGGAGVSGQVGTLPSAGHAAGAVAALNAGAPAADAGVSCVAPGRDCAVNDCCVGSTCVVTNTGDICAANCSQAAQCASGCCVALEGGGAVCAPASNCTAPTTLSWSEWCRPIAESQCGDVAQCYGAGSATTCVTDAISACCAGACVGESGHSQSDLNQCLIELGRRSCAQLGELPNACKYPL